MSYYNRDNIFNLQPIGKGINGIQGASGQKGDTGNEGEFGLTTFTRLYQELNGDTFYNSVNGYYALAKDTYPSPSPAYVSNIFNQLSRNSGMATNILSTGILWVPFISKFLLFLSNNNRVASSINGINWRDIVVLSGVRNGCYSDTLNLIVAISINTSNVYTSNDAITWQTIINPGITFTQWRQVIWSKELNMFIAVSSLYKIMYSYDALNWQLVNLPESDKNIALISVAWSPELSLFVAVSTSSSINKTILVSNNGIDWELLDYNLPANKICWSSDFNMFVTCNGFNYSYNGYDWFVNTNNQNFRPVVLENCSNITTTIISCNDTSKLQISMIFDTNPQRIVTSINSGTSFTFDGATTINAGTTLTEIIGYDDICYNPYLKCFVTVGNNRLNYSFDGFNWCLNQTLFNRRALKIDYSPELGIYCGSLFYSNSHGAFITSLPGRHPASINTFNYSSNFIDEFGNWTIQDTLKGISTTNTSINLGVTGLNYCSIGNTLGVTISNLTGGVSFQKIVLYFENDNTTIESNNNIKLQNGNTFVGTTFDTLSLLYTGTNRVEISRSVNL